MKPAVLILVLLLPLFSLAQFTGRVVDERNEGVPFASVSVKGTSKGTSTDSTGHFSFVIDEKFPFTLTITSVGFSAHELVVRNNNVNNVLIQLQSTYKTDTVVTISRRRREILQDVPMPVTI